MKAPLKLSEIEVFVIDIKNLIQVEQLLTKLEQSFPKLKIDYDLSTSEAPYPCGHTVLRVEGNEISSDKIRSTISHLGFNCQVLEDKVCN